jgi:hypothetical protein
MKQKKKKFKRNKDFDMFIFLTRLLFVPLYNVALYLFLPHYKVALYLIVPNKEERKRE